MGTDYKVHVANTVAGHQERFVHLIQAGDTWVKWVTSRYEERMACLPAHVFCPLISANQTSFRQRLTASEMLSHFSCQQHMSYGVAPAGDAHFIQVNYYGARFTGWH